jgi:hypothetical protein
MERIYPTESKVEHHPEEKRQSQGHATNPQHYHEPKRLVARHTPQLLKSTFAIVPGEFFFLFNRRNSRTKIFDGLIVRMMEHQPFSIESMREERKL